MKPFIALILLASSSLVFASDSSTSFADKRTPVKLEAQQKAFVFERMRRMLETLTGVQQALASQQPENVNDIVMQMLQYSRQHRPENIHDAMPEAFQSMSQQMNQHWRSLAKQQHDAPAIQEKVISIMSTCNACHRSYRIE